MNNEQDKKIKSFFEDDKIVSENANMVFDNFISELKSKNTNPQIEEEPKVKLVEEPKSKIVLFNFRKFAAIAASFVIVFVGSNVYAHTKGYENIFFLIKDLTTIKSEENQNEIFSDRDIVISYTSFNVTSDVEMQINELQVKDNKAKLYLLVKELENNADTPLKYKVYDEQNNILYNEESKKKQNEKIYTEVLNLSNYTDDIDSFKIEIFNKNDELLKTVNLNLNEKTIEAKTENAAIQKVSQIELNKFLKQETMKKFTEAELKNKEIIILETFDIFYSEGKYVVKYLYMMPSKEDFENDNIENTDIYTNTATFVIEKDGYKLEKLEIPEKI